MLGILLLLVLCSSAFGAGLVTYDSVRDRPYTVSYDERSFFIDNQRTLLLSGAIHYPRSTPAMWDDVLQRAKDDGFNAVESYVFWSDACEMT